MARARFQEGTLGIVGKGPKARYVARYRVYAEDGTSTAKKEHIGLVSAMSKREANKKKAELVMLGTSQVALPVGSAEKAVVTFGDFYRDKFLKVKEKAWSATFLKDFQYQIGIVLESFDKLPLRDIDKFMLQNALNRLDPHYGESTISHVRKSLNAVFAEAHEAEYINRNPATRLTVPVSARKPHKPLLDPEWMAQIADRITDARDKALWMTGCFCALRSGEAFGLPWKSLILSKEQTVGAFLISQTAHRGKIQPWTKNEASNAPVHIPPSTLNAILQWQKECKDTSPDALIFQSTNKNGRAKKGAPMHPGIWYQKKIQPVAASLGIEVKVNFRATRRTEATEIQEQGGSLASASRVLRHSSPRTTGNIYSQPLTAQVMSEVDDYEARVMASRPKAKLKLVK